MGKFAAIGAAILPSLAAGSTAATIVGVGATALAGTMIASSVKSLTAGGGGGGGDFNVPGTPSVPTTQGAQAAAQQQTKEQKRRLSKRVFTSQEDQANLLATPSTTSVSLLGQ
jgi:hypothetical protein